MSVFWLQLIPEADVKEWRVSVLYRGHGRTQMVLLKLLHRKTWCVWKSRLKEECVRSYMVYFL